MTIYFRDPHQPSQCVHGASDICGCSSLLHWDKLKDAVWLRVMLNSLTLIMIVYPSIFTTS